MSTAETTSEGVGALRDLPGWQSLAAHFQQIRDRHLRELFASDPGRGER